MCPQCGSAAAVHSIDGWAAMAQANDGRASGSLRADAGVRPGRAAWVPGPVLPAARVPQPSPQSGFPDPSQYQQSGFPDPSQYQRARTLGPAGPASSPGSPAGPPSGQPSGYRGGSRGRASRRPGGPAAGNGRRQLCLRGRHRRCRPGRGHEGHRPGDRAAGCARRSTSAWCQPWPPGRRRCCASGWRSPSGIPTCAPASMTRWSSWPAAPAYCRWPVPCAVRTVEQSDALVAQLRS